MKSTHISGLLFAIIFLLALPVLADELPEYTLGGSVIHGGSPGLAKAGGDTINLMAASDDPTNNVNPLDYGLEPYYDGDFENEFGIPDWNGWTHYDITAPTTSNWNVSNYNQPDPANFAAWCGDIKIPSCGVDDPEGGYGNSWNDILEFRQTVPNTGTSSMVTVTATLIHDSEPGYDYTYLSYQFEGDSFADMQIWDGAGTVAVFNSVSYLPADYLGGTDIAVYFRFRSDGGWSDEDCSFPSAGGCQVDDIDVHIVNGAFDAHFFEDFEHGGDPADFGIWDIKLPSGVGDFSHIWTGLRDIDPCISNYTPQVAFIDDGIVVPGTGGTECVNWCYGPGGYIVPTTGGLAGPAEHLHNAIESPVMAWPSPKGGAAGPDYDGINLAFTVFRHEDLSWDSPGVFFTWAVRSADTDDSAGNGVQVITNQGWLDRNFVFYGGPDYLRSHNEVTDLMNPGRDEVQVQLTVYELGWVWGFDGNDGTPAPYFDDVTVKIYPHLGPGMASREIDLAQDNFPARGTIDYGDLGSHSVRFDMARNISLASHLRNDPGDSIYVTIAPIRTGSDMDGDPELHYIMDRNPVFDPYRTSGLPAIGSVTGRPAVGLSGQPTPDQWAFDLPDTGFLFPGDVLHYYISATDAIGGVGGSDPRTALMPSDTTGFSTSFGNPMGYNSTFTIHALPSIRSDGFEGFDHPEILFINDFANRGGENEWYTALNNLGYLVNEDYDVYYVNGPSSGVGNGIGGRASHLMLTDYDIIIYTSGDLGVNTISNGDFNNDAGDDVGTLTNWLDIGGKDMFLTGDNLASDLNQAGTATLAFAEQYMGVRLTTFSIRSFIGNQATPLVNVIPGNPVFMGQLQSWYAFGGCYSRNTFDGVEVMGAATRLAEFLNPSGLPAYNFSAATLNPNGTSRIISMPVDLMYVYTDPSAAGNLLAGRTQLLGDVLQYFGMVGNPLNVSPVLPGITFQTSNYPNPFNPSTTIKYSMPKAGHLKLCVYNVRGQLVKTLIDGVRPAGADQTIVWDGMDERGSSVASGVYFYEARALGDIRIGKTTLLK
ncbi:MAG: hypothetical protein DRP71_12465 [Verrucomicrobia bacterium]|nr:MAG: hypothetical protein DRP71_12465 [Verrucomicrobiota bacterium]